MTDRYAPLKDNDPASTARQLLGWRLVSTVDGQLTAGTIVETEAYGEEDAASHSFRGPTPRTLPMFGPAGTAYVYLIYGLHHCFNVVTGPDGRGQAALIRALEPTDGWEIMRRRRGTDSLQSLCSGPAKLCQALGIGPPLNGHSLAQPPLQLLPSSSPLPNQVITDTRIGITKERGRLWRFYLADNSYVSTYKK